MKHIIRVPIRRNAGVYESHNLACVAANGSKRPLWKKAEDHLLVLSENTNSDYESKPYDPSPTRGQVLNFSLLFDVSVERGEYKKTRRIDPVLQAWIDSGKTASWSEVGFLEGKNWLKRREQDRGFRILEKEIQLCEYTPIEFIRKGVSIRIGAINYSGMVEVTDSEKFKTAMVNGLGHSKAWGCGLILCNRV